MVAQFEQLIGAAGDVRELEYISALHQTDMSQVRKDASIKAEDIRLFLSSRYGIVVDDEQVRKTILSGLGGGSTEDDVLDLMEVVAILLIPTFLKAADAKVLKSKGVEEEEEELANEQPQKKQQQKFAEEIVPAPTGLIDYVLKMILDDVTGDQSPKPLSKDLIRRILVAYGECDLAADDALVEEMHEAAVGGQGEEVTISGEQQTASASTNSSFTTMLNAQSFAEGLTHDIRLYDVNNEARLTTNFDDVYVTEEVVQAKEEEMFGTVTNDEELIAAHKETLHYREKLAASEDLERLDTIPSIDTAAGTYRNKALLVLLWATILITYFAYVNLFDRQVAQACYEGELAYEYNSPWASNSDSMLCEVFVSVVNWIFFFFGFAIFGVIFVYLGSIGNSVDCDEPWQPLVGGILVFAGVVIPYGTMRDLERQENEILYVSSLILGVITSCVHFSQALSLYLSPSTMKLLRSWIPAATHPFFISTISAERAVKLASARKLSNLTKNALEIVQKKSKDSMLNHYGQALKSYETEGKKFKTVGGFLWVWRRHFNRRDPAFSREGIWIPSRMIASNIIQYVVAAYILIAGLFLTEHVANEYDQEWAKQQVDMLLESVLRSETEDEIANAVVTNVTSVVSQYLSASHASGTDFGCGDFSTTTSTQEFLDKYCEGDSLQCDTTADVNYLCPLLNADDLDATSQAALLNASGFDEGLVRQVAYEAAQEAAENSVDSLYPTEKYMVVVPLYIGTIVAFLVAISLAVIYIPSVTSTMLKLRCGVIPTLRNKDFNRYRCAQDQVALLTGSLFWGALFSSMLVGGAIGFVVFFFLWQATAHYAQRLVAMLCGVVSVFLLRLTMVCTCRCTMYRGFYRVKPRVANISILALEWGNFALSVSYIIARSIKLLLTSAAFIGRIDTPFLAHNVGRLGPIELDNYPTVHTKDVLSHEAHRHPYIEALGVMYLMKLRFTKHFGKRAGTCWRLIFVYALMPWLHKYRILARSDQTDKKKLNDIEKEFPSLHFVSLRNVYNSGNNIDDDDDEADVADEPGLDEMIVSAPLPPAIPAPSSKGNNSMKDKKQILELQEEVKRLKELLASSSNSPAQNLNTVFSV